MKRETSLGTTVIGVILLGIVAFSIFYLADCIADDLFT